MEKGEIWGNSQVLILLWKQGKLMEKLPLCGYARFPISICCFLNIFDFPSLIFSLPDNPI